MQQPLPTIETPWEESVQYLLCMTVATGRRAWFAQHIKVRADEGYDTYGTYLGVGNPGRDGDRDLKDELFDAMVYAFELYLSTKEQRFCVAVLQVAETLEGLYGAG
jgi:hypothetical protein